MDKAFTKKGAVDKFYHDSFEKFYDMPCFRDFFRYIQWYNLAFTTTEGLCLPTMIIHYKNYMTSSDQTNNDLLKFLNLDKSASILSLR